MPKLMLSLVGQAKRDEAREVYQRGVELVATIVDNDLKEDEDVAMQDMGARIDSLV